MTAARPAESAGAGPADLLDERLVSRRGSGGHLDGFRNRLRAGDLGPLPVIVGLAVIWVVFQTQNSAFLSSRNLVNLALQSAAVGIIAIGIVLILLLGEIDLSVGSVSGVASAVLAVGFVQEGWPLVLAIVAAILIGTVIGLLYGFLYTRFGVPAFVITLAGLLGLLGLQLYILGDTGSLNIPFDSALVEFCQNRFLPATVSYLVVVGAVAAYVGSALRTSRRRAAAGLSGRLMPDIAVRGVLLAVVLTVPTWFLNRDRGIGYVFVLFVALVVGTDLVLRKTTFGRSVYAVGGNVEAARRAGIAVNRVYITVFAATSTFAALGGVLAAGRLAAANQGSGGGDVNLNAIAAAVIGGTSLFGGRGSAYAALIGIVVIQSISSGLTLLSYDSDIRYMVTGAVLLLAVTIDSISRRSRVSHGRA